MKNHGSRKVLQWKLDIQHYYATIEHVQGTLNTPADAFSRLVEKAPSVSIHHIMVLKCSATQRKLIQNFHERLCAHNGVERTIALLTQHCPDETSTLHWKNLRHDVREYVMSCPTCQKWTHLTKLYGRHNSSSLHESRCSASPWTIGPLSIAKQFKYILVIIDTFTRYVELFPSKDVSADAATDALWRHSCRFGTPLEIMTDYGTQFMNTDRPCKDLRHYRIRHHISIPYSKEENGIVERENKEVNRHIRNILSDKECVANWPQMLCMHLDSVKQPLGASATALLFGNATVQEPGMMAEMDQMPSDR